MKMPSKTLPSQEEADFSRPDEHFVWALRNLPMIAGSGLLALAPFLRGWSTHLWECGFAHRSYLEGLADPDGNIHVSKLPKQQKEFRPAFRGPQHNWNNAARWAHPSEPQPEVMVIPDIKSFTTQEKYALAYQLHQQGINLPEEVRPAPAQVFDERTAEE